VAIDSTRVRAWGSRDRIDTELRLRNERARYGAGRKACDGSDPEEGAGVRVEERTGASPEKSLGRCRILQHQNVRELEARGIDVYVPDPNLARELNTGKRARTIGRNRVRSPELKLRSRAGRRVYERRKTLVEPVFGVLKQQRGMRQFCTRGAAKVATEFTLAASLENSRK
jgi:hypothetical protein